MSLFLPPTIVIDVWLLFEPPCDPPAGPGELADGPPGDAQPPAAVSKASLAALDPASDGDSLYDGYHLVPAYFWHRQDSAFSTPWQHLVDTQIDGDHETPEPKPRPAHSRHGPDASSETADNAD